MCHQDGSSDYREAECDRHARLKFYCISYLIHLTEICLLLGAYHGRTFGTMALTKSKTIYSEGSSPLMVCRVYGVSYFDPSLNTLIARGVYNAIPILASEPFTPLHERGRPCPEMPLSVRASPEHADCP